MNNRHRRVEKLKIKSDDFIRVANGELMPRDLVEELMEQFWIENGNFNRR